MLVHYRFGGKRKQERDNELPGPGSYSAGNSAFATKMNNSKMG
jgi:hypothetical protein